MRAGLRVERTERLVHQQDIGISRERAGECRALLHPAGKLRGKAVLETGQVHHVDKGLRARPGFVALRFPRLPMPYQHVLPHGLPGEQREVLKHHAAFRPRAGDDALGRADAAGAHRKEAADAIEQGALAASARPKQGVEAAGRHGERHVVERPDIGAGLGAIAEGQMFDDDPVRRCRRVHALWVIRFFASSTNDRLAYFGATWMVSFSTPISCAISIGF